MTYMIGLCLIAQPTLILTNFSITSCCILCCETSSLPMCSGTRIGHMASRNGAVGVLTAQDRSDRTLSLISIRERQEMKL
jgi:hypothetical protein